MRQQIAMALLIAAWWVIAGCVVFFAIVLKRWLHSRLSDVYWDWRYGRALSRHHRPFSAHLLKRIERRRKESAQIVLIEPVKQDVDWKDLN